MSEPSPLFREEQRFRQIWLWVLVLVGAVLPWWSFVEQILLGRPFGAKPGPDWFVLLTFSLFGVGVPFLLVASRLVTEVRPDGLHLRFVPLSRRRVPFSDVQAYRVCDYRPLREFGGWGLRYRRRWGWAYNISGSRGVELRLTGDRRLLVGSQQPEQLVERIAAASGRQPEPPRVHGPLW